MSELNDFLKKLLRVDDVKSMADDDSPPWWQEGVTVEVDESTYYDLFGFASTAIHERFAVRVW